MKKWLGAAGICVNDNNQLLMVKQGTPEEKKVWSVPSGGKEAGETFEDCCIREVSEETGYDVRIVQPLFVKESVYDDVDVVVHYFAVEVCGGSAKIQDPDQLIYEIAWKSADELADLELTYPDDWEVLLESLKSITV